MPPRQSLGIRTLGRVFPFKYPSGTLLHCTAPRTGQCELAPGMTIPPETFRGRPHGKGLSLCSQLFRKRKSSSMVSFALEIEPTTTRFKRKHTCLHCVCLIRGLVEKSLPLGGGQGAATGCPCSRFICFADWRGGHPALNVKLKQSKSSRGSLLIQLRPPLCLIIHHHYGEQASPAWVLTRAYPSSAPLPGWWAGPPLVHYLCHCWATSLHGMEKSSPHTLLWGNSGRKEEDHCYLSSMLLWHR